MRIVIDGRYIQDRFPGIGRYTYNLIKSLGELGTGDEIIVLINSKLTNQRYDLLALSDFDDLTLENCDIPRYLPNELLSLPRYVNRLKPDLFHSPFFLRPYPLSCPCVITLHDLIPLDYPRSTGSFVNTVIFRIGANLACRLSSIITPSVASAEDIKKRFKVPEEKVHPILSAPDPHFRRQPKENILQMRQRYSLHKPYVLHVGSHLPHKNVKGLITAWANLKLNSDRQNNRHQLVLAGWESKDNSEERRLVKKLQIEQYVTFLGEVDEKMLPSLYSGADLFVFPSFVEGYGFPVIEAMACGTAVICSDIPSLRELSAGAAWLINPADTDMLTHSLNRLLSDRKLQEEFSQKGSARHRQFNWIDIAKETYDVYRQVHKGA